MSELNSINTEEREWLAEQRREWRDWQAAHPHYCRACRGAGGRDIPASYSEPGDFDECPDCVASDRCPWCQAPILRSVDADGVEYVVCANDDCEWELGAYVQ